MGVAVVGCGAWGRNLVRNFAELGALTGIVDHHEDNAAELVARHGGAHLTFEAALANPAVTAMAIATPPAQHYALAKRALEAGKHVFVEKPLALDMEEARELCALAERLDRRLMVGHILQYHPAFMRLQELVREGRLGRLHSLSARRMNLGRIRREEDVMWDLAPHDISMVLALIGADPDRVTAIGGCHLRPDIADTASLYLGFAGGEQAGVTVSWLHPVKEHRLVVIGSEAMAVFDDGEPWERKLVLFPHRVEWRDGAPIPVRGEPVPVEVAPAEPLREECRHFLDCVRTGARPRTDGREGLRVMSVLDRASRFMDEARPAALRDIA